MKYFKLALVTLLALAAVFAKADDKVVVRQTTNVAELEDDIKLQEELVLDMKDSVAVLESNMAFLKARLDSVNAIAKDLKSQISTLEKLKKEQEKGIKLANKTRQATFESRDNLVYQQEVLDVLTEPYDKLKVESSLASFDGMETKDVIKRKDMVQNYGKYTKEIREFLEKQKSTFEQLRWATQGTDSEAYKKFAKGFKGLSYHKIFEKGQKNVSNPTIPYLDKVMTSIQLLQRSGFNSKYQFEQVLDMLY